MKGPVSGAFFFTVLFLSVCFLSSCETVPADYQASNTDLSSLKVVVLPFRNLTTTPDAGKAVTALFASDLLIRHPFTLLPLSRQEAISSLFSDQSLSAQTRATLKSEGGDAALTGVVSEFNYEVGGSTRPVVALSWSLISLQTGRILWSANTSRMGSCFWTCRETVSGLASNLIDEQVRKIVRK